MSQLSIRSPLKGVALNHPAPLKRGLARPLDLASGLRSPLADVIVN
jgi:uncharacterized protein YhdP